MFLFLLFLFGFIIFVLLHRRFINPYKLIMVFGKKGSGKSSFLVKQAIYYLRKGFFVYTNMDDLCLDGVRIIDANELGDFVPVANSVLLLDEVGMLYDNRNFKNFKNSVRDFFKLQRHYKVICFLASQTYDIDKKLRDLCDSMILVNSVFVCFSLIRPIHKAITLTEAVADGESRIAENLKFRFITSWRLMYIPKYSKYFSSFKVPDLPELRFKYPENSIKNRKLKSARV